LASQPQEPPWQSFPTAAAEQQDSYSYPPPPGPSSGQGYGQGSYTQQPGQGYSGPSYTPADQVYQAAGAQDQAYQDQAYQAAGAQDQGYPGPQGQSTPQWQAGLSSAAAARAQDHAKGFFGALFDFSFTSMVTPKLVKVLYVLITLWTALWALIFLRYGFKYGGAVGGFFTLLVVDPILILLTLSAWRVVLGLFMVVHRMQEHLKAIRERGDGM